MIIEFRTKSNTNSCPDILHKYEGSELVEYLTICRISNSIIGERAVVTSSKVYVTVLDNFLPGPSKNFLPKISPKTAAAAPAFLTVEDACILSVTGSKSEFILIKLRCCRQGFVGAKATQLCKIIMHTTPENRVIVDNLFVWKSDQSLLAAMLAIKVLEIKSIGNLSCMLVELSVKK